MPKTNKLFEYGLEAAKVGRILLDAELRTPQRTLTGAAHYWPLEALSFANAAACVDIVLLCSKEASTAYYEAVKALESPGCQALISDTKTEVSAYASNLQQFTHKATTAARKGQFTPPSKLHKYADDGDYLLYIERIREFIRVGFNRQVDRDNEAWKVKLESAPTLFGFIICRTIAEHCKVKLENWNKYRPDDIERMMSGNPTTRPERQTKRVIRQTYNRYNWTLRHDVKLLKYADQWYKCRVSPGTIEQYISDESNRIDKQAEQLSDQELESYYSNKRSAIYPERSNIETTIAPCDGDLVSQTIC